MDMRNKHPILRMSPEFYSTVQRSNRNTRSAQPNRSKTSNAPVGSPFLHIFTALQGVPRVGQYPPILRVLNSTCLASIDLNMVLLGAAVASRASRGSVQVPVVCSLQKPFIHKVTFWGVQARSRQGPGKVRIGPALDPLNVGRPASNLLTGPRPY